MEIFDHPVLLVFAGILSLLSGWFCWVGFKEKDVPNIMYGIGLGVPTMAMMDWRFWAAGLGICAGGVYLRRSLEL